MSSYSVRMWENPDQKKKMLIRTLFKQWWSCEKLSSLRKIPKLGQISCYGYFVEMHSLQTRKLSEISVFWAISIAENRCVVRLAIWYRLYNLKDVKNAHEGVLILNLTLLHGCFSRFLNCANSTKSRNAPYIQSV